MTAMPPQSAPIEPISGEAAKYLLNAADNRGLPGTFHYWRGRNGHVFLDPIPADLDRYYAEGYQPIPQDEAALAEVARDDAYRLDPIKRIKPGGSFLEIGPWIGRVAYSAKLAGYAVSVLERDGDCVDLLRRAGIDSIHSVDPAETLAKLGRTFDVIGLWHSIEHLPRPWEVITAAARALNPGGLLVVAAPNPDSAQFRLFGKHWVHLDAPRHIHLLPIGVIESIAAKEGLVTLERTTDDQLAREIDTYGLNFEVRRRKLRVGDLPLRVNHLLNRAMRWLTPGSGPLGGGGYTIIMQRPER
jgi:SAM-dependent methyltransferase